MDGNQLWLILFLLWALGVSLWLAIVTYKLYRIASGQFNSVKKAGDAAEKSAIIAQSTFTMTKQYNKEINAPYLQVEIDKVIIHDTPDKPAMVVFVYYNIYNLTQTPVKIISKIRSHPVISSSVPQATEEVNMVTIPDVNNYIIKESPDSEYAYGHNVYTKEIFEDFRKGRQKLYMDEIIEYQNLINGEKRKYKFRVQVTLTTGEVPYTIFLLNENYDVT